jgi:hypothetical protein
VRRRMWRIAELERDSEERRLANEREARDEAAEASGRGMQREEDDWAAVWASGRARSDQKVVLDVVGLGGNESTIVEGVKMDKWMEAIGSVPEGCPAERFDLVWTISWVSESGSSSVNPKRSRIDLPLTATFSNNGTSDSRPCHVARFSLNNSAIVTRSTVSTNGTPTLATLPSPSMRLKCWTFSTRPVCVKSFRRWICICLVTVRIRRISGISFQGNGPRGHMMRKCLGLPGVVSCRRVPGGTV